MLLKWISNYFKRQEITISSFKVLIKEFKTIYPKDDSSIIEDNIMNLWYNNKHKNKYFSTLTF